MGEGTAQQPEPDSQDGIDDRNGDHPHRAADRREAQAYKADRPSYLWAIQVRDADGRSFERCAGVPMLSTNLAASNSDCERHFAVRGVLA